MIPETLGGWTLEVIHRLVEQGIFETDRFDFKEMLPNPKDDAGKRRLRRDIAAFANVEGGFLIYGVKDDKRLPAEQRIVGVPKTQDFPVEFGNFPSACEPSVAWDFKNSPLMIDGGRAIHVVHVPSSRTKPHGVFEEDRWWFPKRTNKGTEPMSYEEVRQAFLDAGRRRSELAWLKSEVTRIRDLSQRVNILSSRTGDFDEHGEFHPLDPAPAETDPDHQLDVLSARYNADQLKGLILSVFGDIGTDPNLVASLQRLVERCAQADAAVAPLAIFALRPRDRSYSGGRYNLLDVARRFAFQIVTEAARIVALLEQLGL
ncbi:MAG: ATP-binding protein [Myxococcales bacterium]|nr:ATP-binding protein [Myxococcales bacterium]